MLRILSRENRVPRKYIQHKEIRQIWEYGEKLCPVQT